MTLSTLRTECQTCSGWAEFAGRTTLIDGETFAVAYCPQCRVDIYFWTPAVEKSLAAFRRAEELRAIAIRLCGVASGLEDEIRVSLALPTTPPPLDARECELTAGVLSRASVELRFSPGQLARGDLDSTLGQAEVLPRTGPGAAHNLVYAVRVAGAPACIGVFAAFRESPQATSDVKGVLLRIDPA